jgi:hypothetical protein
VASIVVGTVAEIGILLLAVAQLIGLLLVGICALSANRFAGFGI